MLRRAAGDLLGRIYEYFLAEFSKQGAHDNGEIYTPPSIVQTIVNLIEPEHGIVLDPASEFVADRWSEVRAYGTRSASCHARSGRGGPSRV